MIMHTFCSTHVILCTTRRNREKSQVREISTAAVSKKAQRKGKDIDVSYYSSFIKSTNFYLLSLITS